MVASRLRSRQAGGGHVRCDRGVRRSSGSSLFVALDAADLPHVLPVRPTDRAARADSEPTDLHPLNRAARLALTPQPRPRSGLRPGPWRIVESPILIDGRNRSPRAHGAKWKAAARRMLRGTRRNWRETQCTDGRTASAFALGSTPPIVGCGNSTITIAQTSSGMTVSGVIPSDRTGVSSIEKQGERGEDVKTREASR